MKWTANKVLRGFLIGVLLCSLYAKLSSPVLMVNRAEDAVVVLKIIKNEQVDLGPLLPTPSHKHKRKHKHKKHKIVDVQLKKRERTYLCAGYIADNYGHIVTAAHCVVGGKDIVSVSVYLHGERAQYNAKVILVKPLLDIALLQAPLPKDAPYLVTKDGYEWPGTHMYAIGHPLGLFYSVSEGIVSAYASGMNGSTFMQGTAAVNPGNSGGPAIDDQGRVIGVCSFMAVAPWGTPANGLGFWVPSSTINIVMTGQLNHD